MEPVDSFEHAGLTVRVRWEEYDTSHANPRGDTNLGVMFCDYRGYDLGDDDADDPRGHTRECTACKGEGYLPHDGNPGHYVYSDSTMICEACAGNGEIEESIVEYLVREHDARVVLPLFVYEHSGITMSAGGNLLAGEDNLVSRNRFLGDSDGWDTSTVGVIYDTAESRKECGCEDFDAEQIAKQLDEEVRYYAAYLEGSVYGYEVVRSEDDDEVLDSCWGFLELNVWDADAGVREEGRSAAEWCAQEIKNEAAEAHRWACADVVTV